MTTKPCVKCGVSTDEPRKGLCPKCYHQARRARQALPAAKQRAFEEAAKAKGWIVDDQPSNDWQALAAEIAAEPPAEPYMKPRRSK